MAARRLPIRRLRELLRLKYEAGLSHRAIARRVRWGWPQSRPTCNARRRPACLQWPLPEALDDATLEARLFARPAVPSARDHVVPDWSQLHLELKKPGVTLSLLWVEYRAQHPDGYGYSQFCERYRRWARVLKPSMRHVRGAQVARGARRPELFRAVTGVEDRRSAGATQFRDPS